MYRRRIKSTTSSSSQSSLGRGSDIKPPNNTSLHVNQSKLSQASENDSVEMSVAALLTDDDDSVLERPSTSLIYSMSQKKQSTPQTLGVRRVLSVSNGPSDKQSKSLSQFSTKNNLSQETRNTRSSQKKEANKSKNQQLSTFLQVLFECGAEEISDDGSFILAEDQAKFSLKLHERLKDGDILNQFLQSLETYMDDAGKLQKLLMFTQTSMECELARGPVQEPMLRLLLYVDCLQSKLLTLLLEKMATMIIDSQAGGDLTPISSILRQARCLNRVQDTKFGCRLFELIEVSSFEIQKEIVHMLPELILEDELEYAALQLVELLNAGSELTPTIIESLSCLSLEAALHEQIRLKILRRLDKSPAAYLPSLTQFVTSKCETSNMVQMITSLREHLPFTLARWEKNLSDCSTNEEFRREIDSYVGLTFENLKDSVMSSKQLTEAWLKVIQNVVASNDFRPVDLMMLILIHGHVLSRKPTVITLLKNKIRSGIFLDEHIHQTFKILRIVLTTNHQETLELASALLKSFEQPIADLAISFYIEIFREFNDFLRRDVICDIIPQIMTGSCSTVQNALDLLVKLRDSHKKEMEAQANALISLLTKLQDLTVLQARQLVDVLASLIVSPTQEDTGLLEELQIFSRKKVAGWQLDMQKRGIVSNLMIVKHSSLAGSEISHIGPDPMFRILQGTQSSNVCVQGFLYDELGTMIREMDARPKIITEQRDRILNLFKSNVFVTDLDLEFDHFPISLQYSIDYSDKFVFPVVAFLDKPQEVNVAVISAALRFIWCAEKNFSNIIPIMCASVIIPDASVFDKFLSFQGYEQKMIMDCLFVCANYFIECVNGLATQKTNEKLIIRLKQLIEVRKLIAAHVGQVIDYVPPTCQFHVSATKPVFKKPAVEKKRAPRGRKRKSDGNEVGEDVSPTPLDSTALPCTSTAAPADAIAQMPVTTVCDPTQLSNYNGYFRILHFHTYKLLRMEMKLNPTKVFKKKKISDLLVCDSSWSYRPEDKPELGPSDVLYLLQDFMNKSDEILRPRPPFLAKKETNLVAETMAQSTFVLGSVKLLPKLLITLDIASGYCKDLQEANDDMWDSSGMFPKEAVDIKLVLCALLKIISDILGWRGFQNITHRTILRDTLIALSHMAVVTSTQGINSLCLESAQFLMELGKVVPLMTGAVSLTRSVQACLQYSSAPKELSLVGQLCETFLQRPWFNVNGIRESGPLYNQQVDSILRTYFACAKDKLETVCRAAETASEEVSTFTSKDSEMPTFKALNKMNFPLLYRAICEALLVAASEQLIEHKNNDERCIDVWSTVTKTLMLMVEIAKVHSSRTNLASLLKRSQAIIQLFLSKGLPVMESALRVKSDNVLKILKSLQSVTRFLHSVCCQSKMTSDAVVAAHVPNIRYICERLTLEVKGMLILNKIPLDYITIAVLKNRDIQGNDILSQSSIATSDDESELPPEQETDAPDMETEVTIGEESTSDLF